jgi:RHS repeat-associated protein
MLVLLSTLLALIFSELRSDNYFNYDLNDNLNKIQLDDKSNVSLKYDVLNRAIEIKYQNDTHIFEYDPNGNCTETQDNQGINVYHYDDSNRLKSVQFGNCHPIFYYYNNQDQVVQIVYPNEWIINYEYDQAGHLTTVAAPNGTTRYVYDSQNDLLVKTILPNGITTEYKYDACKRITHVEHKDAEGLSIVSYQYAFDPANNCILLKETVLGNTETLTQFEYDKLNRLIYSKKSTGEFQKYSYDSFGNRLREENLYGTKTFEYNKKNQLIKCEDINFHYDARGNLVQKTSPEGSCQYVYDENNNLIEFKNDNYHVIYAYDASKNRISKSVNGELKRYINDLHSSLPQVLLETDKDYNITTAYVYGHFRLSRTDLNQNNYYIYNYPGRSVTALINSNQKPSALYEYSDFGKPLSEITQSNSFLYNGEAYEEESGLIYLRNRYYDPEAGRFISPDTILGNTLNPQSLNPYVYVSNNPVNLIDLDGFKSAEACVYLGGTITDNNVPSTVGHGFWILTRDDGSVTKIGRAPEGILFGNGTHVDIDKKYPGTISYKFPATDQQIDQIIHDVQYLDSPACTRFYNPFGRNCIAGLERGLDVLGVEHESFRHLGIAVPAKAYIFLENLNGQDTYQKALQQSVDFIFSPRLHPPSLESGPQAPLQSSNALMGSYGGVSLDKAATVLADMTDIIGVTFDQNTNQLIFVGQKDKTVPSMDFDDLNVAVRSLYGIGGPPQDPGVSIDPPPLNEKQNNKKSKKKEYGFDTMLVRYDGQTANTHFGQVMFEADRLLKCLSFGIDNITHESMNPKIKGYKSLPKRYAKAKNMPPLETTTRLWIVPKKMTLAQSEDESTMYFEEASMEVLTEAKWKDKKVHNSPAEDFANHFTEHYDEFAIQYPIFNELKKLGKMTAVVKWIKENQIPFDLTLFASVLPKYCETPLTTQGVFFPYGMNGGQISFINGGVLYHLGEDNYKRIPSKKALELKSRVIDSRPSEDTFKWNFTQNGQKCISIARPLEKSLKVGNEKKSFVDLQLPVPGPLPLQLVRYYNSFNKEDVGLGLGWSLQPAHLEFLSQKAYVKLEDNQQRECHFKIQLIEHEKDSLFKLIGTRNSEPVYTSSTNEAVLVLQADGNYALSNKEGLKLIFDGQGRLLEIRDRTNHSIKYSYKDSRLKSIAHSAGIKIRLNYKEDRLVSAVDTSKKTIGYTYNNQQLESVVDSLGLLSSYAYDSNNNLIAILDAKGKKVFEAEYDCYHRAIKRRIKQETAENKFSLKKHTETQKLNQKLDVRKQFDQQYRLLKMSDSMNRHFEFEYAANSNKPSLFKDSLGNETHFDYDAYGNVVKITDAMGNVQRFWYNQENQLVASTDKKGIGHLYHYDDKHRLISEVYPAYLVSENHNGVISFDFDTDYVRDYTYDDQGNLISSSLGKKKLVSFSYNELGLVTQSVAPLGFKINRTYDSRGRLLTVSDALGGFSYQYDDRDRVRSITSPVGSLEYEYEDALNLIKIKNPNGHVTEYCLDENYHLSQVKDPEKGVTRYEYNSSGKLVKLSFPNGTSREITYDEANRPIAVGF